MKSFYIIAFVVVVALTASPFLLIPKEPHDLYAGKTVLWDTYAAGIKSVDPATCGDSDSAAIQANFYEGLYGYHFLKRPPEVVPLLAAELPEVSDDGLTYTIRLKPGVKYHRNPCFGPDPSGEHAWATRTVRAEDFILGFKRVADYHVNTGLAWAFLSHRIVGIDAYREKTRLDYKSGDFSRYDLDIEGLKALDELTLQIRLSEPFPQLIYVLAMSTCAPVPHEAVDYWLANRDDGAGGRRAIPLEQRATEFREKEQVVGTGPYLLTDWRRKSRIVMQRNPDFREEYYPSEGAPGDEEKGLLADAGKRIPFIDVIHYDFVSETYPSWMLFLTKQRDASGIPRETFEGVVNPDHELAEQWKSRHIYLEKYTVPAIYWIAFNMEDPIFKASKSLRQAMCLAYDVESHIKVLFNDRGVRATNIVPDTFKGHDEAGPGPYSRVDVDAAKVKLAQAKEELATAGLLVNGEIPELKFDLSDGATAVRMAELAQQQFAKLGLKVKPEYNDWPTLQQKVHSKQAQMYTMGWHADYPDAENFLQLFYSPNIAKGTNNSNYSNPEFDALYEKIRVMPDSPQRTELYVRMIRMISEDCPILLLSEPESYVLFYDWVYNVKPHPIGYGFLRYRRIDEAQRNTLGGGR